MLEVQCVLFFKICTTKGRGAEKGKRADYKTNHPNNINFTPLDGYKITFMNCNLLQQKDVYGNLKDKPASKAAVGGRTVLAINGMSLAAAYPSVALVCMPYAPSNNLVHSFDLM